MKEGTQTRLSRKCRLTVLKFHLLCSGLNTQLSVWCSHEVILSFPIESEAEAIEGY